MELSIERLGMPYPIKDEFSTMRKPQVRYRERHRAAGLCLQCPSKAVNASHCRECADKANERGRIRRKVESK